MVNYQEVQISLAFPDNMADDDRTQETLGRRGERRVAGVVALIGTIELVSGEDDR